MISYLNLKLNSKIQFKDIMSYAKELSVLKLILMICILNLKKI